MGEGLQNGSRVGASGLEPLAQLVEHWTFNPDVEGSSPSWLIFWERVNNWLC